MSETEELISRTPLGEVVAAERALTRAHVALGRELTEYGRQGLRLVVEHTVCIADYGQTCGGVECGFIDIANELVGLGLAKRPWENEPKYIEATLRGMQVAEVLPEEKR